MWAKLNVCGCRIDAGTVGLSIEVGQGQMCRVPHEG